MTAEDNFLAREKEKRESGVERWREMRGVRTRKIHAHAREREREFMLWQGGVSHAREKERFRAREGGREHCRCERRARA